jgi:hypothetical protein
MTEIRAPESLNTLFWAGVAALAAYECAGTNPTSAELVIAGNGLIVLALVPMWLWCSGRVGGLPILPLLGMTYVPTFALQLIEPNENVRAYSEELRLAAAVTVAAFLVTATAAWYAVASRPAGPPASYLAFRGERTSGLFLAFVALGCAFQLATNGGWLPDMSPGMYSIIRAICQSAATVGVSLLAFRIGRRRASEGTLVAFAALTLTYLALLAATLVTAPAISTFLAAVAMFTLGRGRLPLGVLCAALAAFSLLHAGKHELRAKYWARGVVLQPADYPGHFVEWAEAGVRRLTSNAERDKGESLKDRSSLLQILLLVESKTPAEKPFLEGDTYEIIPELLVPRILLEDKIWSHEGTYRLNIYYGRQTREQTRTTTIGFGHLAEAYANFGTPGVLGLAAGIGLAAGLVTRWSARVPIDSFRGLCGLVALSLAIQTEHTMGVTASALSQSLQVLLGITALCMTRVEGNSDPDPRVGP